MKEFSTRAACPGSRAAGPRFCLSFGLSFRSCSRLDAAGAGPRVDPLPGGGGGIFRRACGGGSPSYQILHKSDCDNHRRVMQRNNLMHNAHALFRTKQKAPCKKIGVSRNPCRQKFVGCRQCSCSCRITQVLCKHYASIVQVFVKYAQRVLCKMTKGEEIVLRL